MVCSVSVLSKLNCPPDAHVLRCQPSIVNDCIFCWNFEMSFLCPSLLIQLWNFIFSRRYGTKCSGCGQGIAPSDLVRKPRDKVFHLNCFTCCICRKQLSTGEQLYVLDDNKFICKDDYMLGKGSHHHMTGESEIAASSFYNPLIKRREGETNRALKFSAQAKRAHKFYSIIKWFYTNDKNPSPFVSPSFNNSSHHVLSFMSPWLAL